MNEFNSQVCTIIEQSKRLLELGLNVETADCTLTITNGEPVAFIGKTKIDCSRVTINGHEIKRKEIMHIPAWSLHRLMELCPKTIYLEDCPETLYFLTIDPYMVTYERDDMETLKRIEKGNVFDRMVDMIEWLIKNGHFNKEYLEE